MVRADGNVGIGTTSPTSGISSTETTLQIQNGNVAALALNNSSSRKYAIYSGVGGQLGFYDSTADAERMRITSGGNNQYTGDPFIYSNTTSGGTAIHAGLRFNSTDKYIRFFTNDLGRMDITSGGNVLIGTTTDSGAKLQVNGMIRTDRNGMQIPAYSGGSLWEFGSDGSTGSGIYLYNNGVGYSMKLTPAGAATFLSTVTATGFFNSSDNRLKDLIDYDYSVSDIKPITYLWKDGRDNKKHVGYSAQEVQKVMPDAVNEDEKGFLSVNYVEVLVAKIAELENRIKQLEK